MNEKLIQDNTLIVTNDSSRYCLIKNIDKLSGLVNIKVITPRELIENYYFKYDERALYYLMNKYKIKYDIAKIYLENMYYVTQVSDSSKISMLYSLKQELMENHLLRVNNYYDDYLKKKKIVVYNINYLPRIVQGILDNYHYDSVNDYLGNYTHYIYEYKTLEDEVIGCAEKCIKLIQAGTDINKIYLTNLNDEYRLMIKRIFPIFNIPFCLNERVSIYSTHTCHKFLDLYSSDIRKVLEHFADKLSSDEINIYNKIVNICNKYVWCEDFLEVKELVINDLKHTYLNDQKLDDCIKEVSIGQPFSNNDYVFLLGFNQGVFPMIYKDEEYLSDKEKKLLNIETSVELNMNAKEEAISIIKNIQNLYISYKLRTLTDTFSISNINEMLQFEIVAEQKNEYIYSHLYNELSLAKSLDLFNKYGTINFNLNELYHTYSANYRTYDNRFKGINKQLLYTFLNNKLLLSYSSLDNYNRCSFRYYLNNVLKLNIYEETFMQFIGNLFHYVLSKAFLPGFNYDECFDSYINRELSKKESFFIKKLKEELKFIINTINEHNCHTQLDEELYEEKVYVNLEGNIKVTFMGIIDKIKYKYDNERYIVAIIDYKTGNPNLNLNNIIYGIEMQLPIYIYLVNNYPKFKNIELAGFYLQKILNNEIVADKKHSYEDLKRKNLLLQGYSNENQKILEYFDDDYADSSMIKGLKMSSKGFYAYSKVVGNNMIDKILKITEDKINSSAQDILDAQFAINPKRIGSNNLGCEFCSFKDICFHTEKDIVNLKEYKNMEFLGDDTDAKMD